MELGLVHGDPEKSHVVQDYTRILDYITLTFDNDHTGANFIFKIRCDFT